MKEYKPFTQIQDKLIPLSEESYNELKKSFLDNGFLRRKGLIEVWKGHDIIVDGHHRYAICKELGIEPEIKKSHSTQPTKQNFTLLKTKEIGVTSPRAS